MHGGAADARVGPGRRDPGQDAAYDRAGPLCGSRAGSGEPPVQRRRAESLWVADSTYCPTWSGMAYTSFVIDVFSRRIVGWIIASSMTTNLPLDALAMAIWVRNERLEHLVHHSDRGSQYTSIRYTGRLIEAGANLSAGTTGDSYDNALAESIIGAVQSSRTVIVARCLYYSRH